MNRLVLILILIAAMSGCSFGRKKQPHVIESLIPEEWEESLALDAFAVITDRYSVQIGTLCIDDDGTTFSKSLATEFRDAGYALGCPEKAVQVSSSLESLGDGVVFLTVQLARSEKKVFRGSRVYMTERGALTPASGFSVMEEGV